MLPSVSGKAIPYPSNASVKDASSSSLKYHKKLAYGACDVAKVNKPVNTCKDAKIGEHATAGMMAFKDRA